MDWSLHMDDLLGPKTQAEPPNPVESAATPTPPLAIPSQTVLMASPLASKASLPLSPRVSEKVTVLPPAVPASSDATQRLESFYMKFGLHYPGKAVHAAAPITLTGNDLTPQQVVAVARNDAKVIVPEDLMANVQRGFDVLIEAARQGKPVYGVSTGVGKRKTVSVLVGAKGERIEKELTEDEKLDAMLEQSKRFNLTSIRAHTSGTGNPMSRELVRAAMLIRLNTLLKGTGGVSPGVVEALQGFLNNDITPLMPDTGSVGEGDLLLMGHVGLIMIGDWWVVPKNQNEGPESSREDKESAGLDINSPACPRRIVRARQALEEAGMKPVELIAKDFLSIVSNNSLTAGSAALGVYDAAQFLVRETAVFGLCLQGLNGNIAPFLEVTTAGARPFHHMTTMARAIREAVQDSSLWDSTSKFGKQRALQDPLSYRVMHYGLGEVLRGIVDVSDALKIQMNHSDDNPYVVLNYVPAATLSPQEGKYAVPMPDGTTAAIIPTGNFESYPFVAPMEQLLRGLGRLGVDMGKTVARFEDRSITGLPDFLAGSKHGHGFGAVSKGSSGLADLIQATATPSVSANIAVAGGLLEDVGNSGPVIAKKLHDTVGLLYRMASYQLLYATQAIDLRGDFRLSPAAQSLYDQYREKVPFMNVDTQTTSALGIGATLLKNWPAGPAAAASPADARSSAAAGPSSS